jgi:hypothetical protein
MLNYFPLKYFTNIVNLLDFIVNLVYFCATLVKQVDYALSSEFNKEYLP